MMLMGTVAMNEAIKICLKEICSKLDETTRLARAAEACVLAGSVAEFPWTLSNRSMRPDAFMMRSR
jgi:hypothetical protein